MLSFVRMDNMLFYVAITVSLGAAIPLLLHRRRVRRRAWSSDPRPRPPPHVRSWLPWVGSALALAAGAIVRNNAGTLSRMLTSVIHRPKPIPEAVPVRRPSESLLTYADSLSSTA